MSLIEKIKMKAKDLRRDESIFGWIIKAVFGVIIVVLVNDINNSLNRMSTYEGRQDVDHATLEMIKQETDENIKILQKYGIAIQTNTDMIKSYIQDMKSDKSN